MGAIFGKSKPPAQGKSKAPPPLTVTEVDQAKLELKTQQVNLKRFIKKGELMMQRETEMARQLAAEGKRPQALLCLKKKRWQATLLEQATAQINTLEEMVQSIGMAEMQAQIFEAMKQGNEALKAVNATLDVDEIENLMLETREAVDYQNRVAEALAGKLSEDDEQSLEAEIDAIAAAGYAFPAVPVRVPAAGAAAASLSASDDSVETPAATTRAREPALAAS